MPTRDTEDGYSVPNDIWEGMTDQEGNLIEPPDDAAETAITRSERAAVDVSEFWNARPILSHIHAFARSRYVSPWAVLGGVLARVVCQVSADVQLPPVIGTYASLNLFIGLVGPSGDGKGAAQGVAADAVHIADPQFRVNPLGSGEGLSHMFMKPGRKTKEDPNPEPIQYNRKALVTVAEIDSMDALMKRQSSTVASQLRQGAMGEALGFFYADSAKRMIVPDHEYRLCLIAGIQPKRSAVLLRDEDGGTPQRFVWLPSTDPGMVRHPPEEPTPWIWEPPDFSTAPRAHGQQHPRFLIAIPDRVRDIIIDARVNRAHGEGDALDSHALLTREKVATALAILDGRIAMRMDDWELSGVPMAVSDAQRALCQRALAQMAEKENTQKALAEADRSIVVEERIDRAKVTKCAEAVRRLLLQHGPLAGADLRRRLRANHREHLEAALDSMALAGEVDAEKVTGGGSSKGFRYALVRR
jgi:hypothetical protein